MIKVADYYMPTKADFEANLLPPNLTYEDLIDNFYNKRGSVNEHDLIREGENTYSVVKEDFTLTHSDKPEQKYHFNTLRIFNTKTQKPLRTIMLDFMKVSESRFDSVHAKQPVRP